MVNVRFVFGSPGKENWEDDQKCESFTHEMHEPSGLYTLKFHDIIGSDTKLVRVVTGVAEFRIERL